MKKYNYPYQKIQDLRKKDVSEAQKKYGEALQALENAQNLLQKYNDEERQLQLERAQAKVTSTHQLCSDFQYYKEVQKRKAKQIEVVLELERNLSLRHNNLMKAYQEEKKWDRLQEIKREAFNEEQAKIEQQELDEISLRIFSVQK